MSDFLKENFKAIVLVMYLLWRVLVGVRPEISREVDGYLRKFGGYRELVALVAEAEKNCNVPGVQRRDMVAAEIQRLFLQIAGENMPINFANLLAELALAKYKKMTGG